MTEISIRSSAFSAGDNRLVRGVVVPYGRPLECGSGRVQFAERSFARSIAERGDKIRLFARGSSRPVGNAVELTETPDGLAGVIDIAPGPDGDAVLAGLRAGHGRFTATVRPMTTERSAGETVATEAALIDIRTEVGPVIPRAVAERRLRLWELS